MQPRRVRKGGNRRVRQLIAFAGILVAIFAVIALVIIFRTLSVLASKDNPGTHHTPVTVQLTENTLQATGIHYGHPTSPPKISRDQAIQIAKTIIGTQANEATYIDAQYVLFSNDNYYSVDAQGQKHYFFQNVPAWVVTFRGLNIASHGPPPTTFNHELNVAINAQTGKYMEEFSYR